MNLLNIIPGQYKKVGGKNGGEYAGACPWCGDGGKGAGSDRFHIWPEQGKGGTYWCRRCDKGGDAIKFLMDHDSLSFRDACARLNLDPAALLPASGKVPSGWQPSAAAAPADIWADHAEKFVAWCHDRLLERPLEKAWLAERGIDPETAARYRLGYNPAHAWREGEAWGVTMARKPDGKLKKLWLPRGVVIPAFDPDGRVHRLRVRQPDQAPRYLVIPGSGREPLLSRPAEAIFVVESELDAILLDAVAGDLVGVVAMGNDSAKPTERLHPILEQALYIGVALDSDEPRYNPERDIMDMAGARSSRWWLEHYPQAVRVPMVGGKDPGEAFQAGVDLRLWILAALPAYFAVKADLEAAKAMHRASLQAERELEKIRAAEAIDAAVVEPQPVPAAVSATPQGESVPAAATPTPEPPADKSTATTATLITLTSGQSFYVTADRAEWDRLSAAGHVVFSDNELARLQRACATMSDEDRLAAALQALEIKSVFPSAWIRRGETITHSEEQSA